MPSAKIEIYFDNIPKKTFYTILVGVESSNGLSETLNFEVCVSRLINWTAHVILILIIYKVVEIKAIYKRYSKPKS